MPDTRYEPIRAGIGTPLSRVDGVAKVTGEARYAAERPAAGLLHGVAVSAPIARGRILEIDETSARAVPGVVEILTHENRPRTAWLDRSFSDETAPPGHPFRALDDEKILFAGQPVAVVIATTFEAARFAASLLRVRCEEEPHEMDFDAARAAAYEPPKKRSGHVKIKPRGDAAQAWEAAPFKMDAEFHLATEHHNPMEMHATTVIHGADGTLTVHDKTQGAQNVQGYLCSVFGLSSDKVRVVNEYVGGGFGSGLRPQWQVQVAVMAALKLERSVRVVMTRQQMFTHVHRPEAWQRVRLATDDDGRLQAVRNEAVTSTSRFEDNQENVVNWGLMAYASPNADGDHKVASRDTYTSGDMRAPGAATGMTLFEMAMDEMAETAGLDPLAFRLLNYTEEDAMTGLPYTSKALREAYRAGAEAFGWEGRPFAPRSMKDGHDLVGQGTATGIWEAGYQTTSARARLALDGRLEVASATADIGTGTYTTMVLVAADALGIDPARITAKLGDSDLPKAPVEGGSTAAASVGAAVDLACRAVGKQLLKAARKVEGDPLGRAGLDDVEFTDGRIVLKEDRARSVELIQAMQAAGLNEVVAEETSGPGLGGSVSQMRTSRATHSAVFAEVRVDEDLGVVRVTRVVNAVAAGRIINPKTARSQILGGVVMGIGMALHEETFADLRLGRWMNHNLAEYHVPAHADVADIQVIFVDEVDPVVTPLGVKGLGEIGIVSTAAAVANAIWHATGQRHRRLPITIDKVID